MAGGNIQEGFLEEGMPELVSRADGFDNEGGRGGIPGRISPTTHCASPPLPTGPDPPLTLVSSDSLQWGHPLSQGVKASATSKAGQPEGTVSDGRGSSLPVGSCSPSRLQCHC